jgi:hypothetical protein
MDKKFYWWSGIIVILVALVAVLVIDSQNEVKSLESCKNLRIRPLTEKFFTWNGMLELNQKGEYQPKCI